MADSYTKRAERAADIQTRPLFDEIAAAVERARKTYEQRRREVQDAANKQLQGITTAQRRAEYRALAAAAGANMGRSGFSYAPMMDVQEQYAAQHADIRSQALSGLLKIADELDQALTEAERSRMTLTRQRSDLIAELAQQYRDQAAAMEIERMKANASLLAAQADYMVAQSRLADSTGGGSGGEAMMSEGARARFMEAFVPMIDAAVQSGNADEFWRQAYGLAKGFGFAGSEQDFVREFGDLVPRSSKLWPPIGAFRPPSVPSSAGSATLLPSHTTVLPRPSSLSWSLRPGASSQPGGYGLLSSHGTASAYGTGAYGRGFGTGQITSIYSPSPRPADNTWIPFQWLRSLGR